MAIELPPLPFDKAALAPHISAETLEFHHGKHHKAYVDKTNELVRGTEFEGQDLPAIIRKAQGPLFNNSAQVWNHSFFWNCLSPKGGGDPSGPLADALTKAFGGIQQFKDEFAKVAIGTFGSGWAWLVQRPDGSLGIVSTQNAQNPLTGPDRPLLTLDVWEHAYYIDYRNARPKFVDAFWNVVHWDFAAQNMA